VAVIEAVNQAKRDFNLDLGRVRRFAHGSTVATNTILEGLGARTALVTTDGFRDVLEIRRHKRYELFNLNYRKIPSLVPRRRAVGVSERVDAKGAVVVPLDEEELRKALSELAEEGVEAVAISFLFSFLNDAHERRAAEIARELLPGCYITISSEVYPQYREYERASTTVVNAYLGPRISSYIDNMARDLKAIGLGVPLFIMQSNGGSISAEEAKRTPCRIVESGPAAGVMATCFFGNLIGRKRLIAFDMGGTTAKAGLIEDGEPRIAAGHEVGGGINLSRINQGGGYYVGMATIDLAEVSAGGGSIAWIDQSGYLKVGPRSAGASPGPICYGLGGNNVTVTDANVLLGRIPSEYFLGGELKLDVDGARRVVRNQLADPLSMSVEETCAGVLKIANANMLRMLRIISVEKGYDPREYSLVAFGGAGPVQAAFLADELGLSEVIIPPAPGLFSAQGVLVADVRYDYRQTHVCAADEVDLAELEAIYARLEGQGRAALVENGVDDGQMTFRRFAELRYLRQAYEIGVSVPPPPLGENSRATIIESFHREHERLYGRSERDSRVKFVNLCLTATGKSSAPTFQELPRGDGSGQAARKPSRRVFFDDIGFVDCPCFERSRLGGGDTIEGPAIVEAVDSTTVVPSCWRVICDDYGNLFMTRSA
jgi:N-methylhydantoinase A